MRKGIVFRWTPLAVDTLIELEEAGRPQVAQQIIEQAVDRRDHQDSSRTSETD